MIWIKEINKEGKAMQVELELGETVLYNRLNRVHEKE